MPDADPPDRSRRAKHSLLPALPEVAYGFWKRWQAFAPRFQIERASRSSQIAENKPGTERHRNCNLAGASDVTGSRHQAAKPEERRTRQEPPQTERPLRGRSGRVTAATVDITTAIVREASDHSGARAPLQGGVALWRSGSVFQPQSPTGPRCCNRSTEIATCHFHALAVVSNLPIERLTRASGFRMSACSPRKQRKFRHIVICTLSRRRILPVWKGIAKGKLLGACAICRGPDPFARILNAGIQGGQGTFAGANVHAYESR